MRDHPTYIAQITSRVACCAMTGARKEKRVMQWPAHTTIQCIHICVGLSVASTRHCAASHAASLPPRSTLPSQPLSMKPCCRCVCVALRRPVTFPHLAPLLSLGTLSEKVCSFIIARSGRLCWKLNWLCFCVKMRLSTCCLLAVKSCGLNEQEGNKRRRNG